MLKTMWIMWITICTLGVHLFRKEVFPYIYNVSGAHGYQQVALCTMFHDKFFYFIERRQIPCFFSFFF